MVRQRRHVKESELSGTKEHRKFKSNSRSSKSKPSFFEKWTNKVALFVSFNIIVLILSIVYFFYQYHLETIVTTPLNVPKVVTQTGLDVPSRFWGSYRPGLYFGMQTRSPTTLAIGLMWFTQKIVNNGIDIRHWCDQWGSVKKYGWLVHDGENFGVQTIEDEAFVLTTSFVKRLGGQHGGDFTSKIAIKPKPNSVQAPISILFYAVANGEAVLQPFVVNEGQLKSIHGETESLGKFSVHFNADETSYTILKYNFLSTQSQGGTAHLKETVLRNLALYQSKDKGQWQILGLIGNALPPGQKSQSKGANNFIVHQVTFLPPFEMEVSFESFSFENRSESLVGPSYDLQLENNVKAFEKKFNNIFQLHSKGYELADIKTAQAVLSNMLGGIGYFYGSSLVKSSHNKEPVSYWQAPLYTAVPSRSFFPRGFLWDEGFHNLLILQWNPEITKDIMGHWLDLMNVEGWIPREQILGSEAKERVPKEFIVQKNLNANPPTFFLTLEILLQKMKDGKIPKDEEFLKRSLPRLKVWFDWFNHTQTGMLPGTYRWRGRDYQTNAELNPKTLTSGLDDFPRASHPTMDERHVDLRCWIALSARVLADISEFINEPFEKYRSTFQYLTDNELLDSLHWSSTSESYSDYGFHSNNVKLVKQTLPVVPGSHEVPKTETIRMVHEQPTLRYIDNFGYVSLFPFLLQIINPGNSKLGKVIEDIKNPKLLWTKYGLRSLAKTSPYYMKYNTEHDPPYWRGPIWININFLAVRALYYYGQVKGPYQTQAYDLYKELRKNIVSNILKEYNRTGYIWEQYNDKTGQGQGSHPFTGWSALVVLMMGELF